MTSIISNDRLIITKAKRKAAEWMPYLQSVFMPMRCTPTPKVPTAAVDQYGRMYYNPDFICSLSVEVVAYVILHECLHCVLSHHKRTQRMCPNIDAQKAFLANIAQDLCIQQALASQIGVHEPDGIVTIGKWQHIPGVTPSQTSEKYFEALCAWQASRPKVPPPPTPPSGEPDDEEDEDDDDQWSNGESDDDDETTDDAEDGDSESGSGDSEDDSESDAEGEGDGESESDAEGDGEGQGGGQSDSDSDSDSESDGDSQGGEGEGDGQSGNGASSPGKGSGSGQGDTQLDTTGMPDMGDICNPADAGSASDGVEKEWEEEPTLADVSNMEKRLREAEVALEELQPTKGSGAGQIYQSLKARLHPMPDPFDQLKHVVSRSIASPVGQPEATYRKWSRRVLPGKARLRGIQRLQPEATILLDTSGSMLDSNVMQRALAIVAKGISRLQNPRIVCCDGAIQSAKRVANMSHFNWDGGGGTDMAAGLIHVDKTYKPDTIVIITDGITDWPAQPTRAKVVCALCRGDWAARIPKWITVVHLYRQGNQYAL
jgi:hypothetical protein